MLLSGGFLFLYPLKSPHMGLSNKLSSTIVDFICCFTLLGIWPRFVEPKRLKKTFLDLELDNKELDGLKIIQLTDLHFHAGTSSRFLKKILSAVNKEKPDLILFTGDFLCYSKMEDRERLKEFLKNLNAPLGCFCTFGNHDYAAYVSRNREGNYTSLPPANPIGGLFKGLRTLFDKTVIGSVAQETLKIPLHEDLLALLAETNFKPLENACHLLPIGLNLVGLGDYALGRCKPKEAFQSYDKKLPGIVLSHNPDTLPLLLNYPGEMILSGHTHGEQIHFPYPPFLRKLSRKLTRLENPAHSRGLYTFAHKKLYVNRGLGCHKPIRLFSPPEILVLRIKGAT